jgi:hypothetical protein
LVLMKNSSIIILFVLWKATKAKAILNDFMVEVACGEECKCSCPNSQVPSGLTQPTGKALNGASKSDVYRKVPLTRIRVNGFFFFNKKHLS